MKQIAFQQLAVFDALHVLELEAESEAAATAEGSLLVVEIIQADRDAAQGWYWNRFSGPLPYDLFEAFAAHRLAAEKRERAWRPISEAPYNKEVCVRAGNMTFLAMLVPDASTNSAEQSCDQWQATREGEHPPCWSGGACWESNEDEVMSLQPDAWRPS